VPSQPQACTDASATAGTVGSYCDSINTLLTFIVTPMLGSISDKVGRRPILLAMLPVGLLPTGSLLIYSYFPSFSVWPFVATKGAINMLVGPTSIAYISDVIAPGHRAAATGLLLGCFFLALTVCPLIGAAVITHQKSMFIVLTAMAALQIPFFYFMLPESLPPSARNDTVISNPFTALKMLNRSRLFRRLTVCACVSGIVIEGMSSTVQFVLKDLFLLNSADLSMMNLWGGIGSFATQAFFLKPLRDCFGEKWLLVMSLFMMAIGNVFVGSIPRSWGVGAVMTSIGTITPWGYLAMPTISALKANNAAEDEQGAIQGALYGAKSLAAGTAPMLIAQLYNWASKHGQEALVLYVGGGLGLVGMIAAISIPSSDHVPKGVAQRWSKGQHQPEDKMESTSDLEYYAAVQDEDE